MPEGGQNFCAYVLKSLSMACGIGGIICTERAKAMCDFITFVDGDGDPLDLIRNGDRPSWVFGTATSAHVGICKYEILSGSNLQGCQDYPDTFTDIDGYPSIVTAQFCALLAPIFCGIALVATFMEFCICTFPGSSIWGGSLYMLAASVMCGVFSIVADPIFCFEDNDLVCETGAGLNWAIAAVVLYFLATCFHCCAPAADPCYKNFQNDNQPKRAIIVEQQPQPVVIQKQPASQRVVVVQQQPQPVVLQQSPMKSPAGRSKKRLSQYDQYGNRIV